MPSKRREEALRLLKRAVCLLRSKRPMPYYDIESLLKLRPANGMTAWRLINEHKA